MEALLIDIEDIDVLPEEVFDLESGISNAKKVLQGLEEENILLLGEFEKDYWQFENHLSKGTTINFDFTELDKFLFSKELPTELKVIVKSWVGELLGKWYPSLARGSYSILLKALDWTNGFQENKVKTLIKEIAGRDVTDASKKSYFNALFNFFNYAELPIADVYTPRMVSYYNSLKVKNNNIRQLPPSSEVIKFSHHLEMYMEELNSYNGNQHLKEKIVFYPIFLWWKLTTVIPLRASEFCNISRDAHSNRDGSYFIELPRKKQDYQSRNIQVITEVEITEEMYNHLQVYRELTEPFGVTETMCSFRSLMAVDDIAHNRSIKKDWNHFHIGILAQLITRFYDDVLNNKYELQINDKNRLTPNSTRHLAFCSLLMQGISPVEIARLGGHKTIASQYHYSYHVEYWVDSEVFNLMKKFKQSTANEQSSVAYVPDEIKLVAYQPNPIGLNEEDFTKVEIGYCTDKLQRCETEECFLGCRHWRITPEEIIEKEEIILEKISEKRREIRELHAFIENLHKQILSDEFTRKSPGTFTSLKAKAKEIGESIHDLTRLHLLQ